MAAGDPEAIHSTPNPVTLNNIDITAELGRRPSRPPNYELEANAFRQLAHEMAENPQNILQKLAEVAHTLCSADTAGISLIDSHEGREVFRWEGLAGVFAAQRHHMMPRHASPCGTTIERNATQLMYLAGRFFPAVMADPPVVEALLIPFHVQGSPIGTVWAVAHNEQRKFDREDERILKTLGTFASGAWQLWRTVQRQASDLRDSEEMGRNRLSELDTIYREAPIGLCVLDTNFRFTRVNNRFAEMHGVPECQIGCRVREVLPHVADIVEPLLQKILTTGEPVSGFEFHDTTPTRPGEPRTFRHSFFPIRTPHGGIIGINVVAEDVTDQIKKEVQLRTLASELSRTEDRERKRLASAIHDNLSQLLAVALLRVERMQKKNDIEQIRRSIIQVKAGLDEALESARTLTEDLRPPLLGQDDDLKAALNWVANKMRRHGLAVSISDFGPPNVLEEDVLVVAYQAVQELLWNVVKHAETSEATLCIDRSGEMAEIVVQDRGKGFDGSHPPRPTQGGFGLFSVQERLNLVGGDLNITSTPYHGTRARIRVPLKSENSPALAASGDASEETVAAGHDSQKNNRISVLLIDDHPLMRNGLRQVIEDQGDMFVIAEGSNGRSAVQLACETTPDLVVMDIDLPIMDGIEATRQIKSHQPNIAVIGLSMHDSPQMVTAMKEAGASDYVTKGAAAHTLCAVIRSTMNRL